MFGIKRELKRTLNKSGAKGELEAFLVCACAQKIVAGFFGGGSAQFQVVKYLKQVHTLEIKLDNMVVGQKIRTNSERIIAKINREMRGRYVEKLRYRLN